MTVIAMTREIGSLGTEVAAGLIGELGLRLFNSEIVVNNVASNLGVHESAVQRFIDGSASFLERWQIDKRKLRRFTFEEVLSLAEQGNVLIRGWGAAALFRDIPQVVSVRVCAPMDFRERVMMERLPDKTTDAIRLEIERFDAAHVKTVRDTFNTEREDALLYHLTLNTRRIPVDICVKMICELARAPQFQDVEATRAAIADKRLEIKVRSALAENLGAESDLLSVSVKSRIVMLDGITSSGGLRAKSEKLVQTIEGIRNIENRIKSVPFRGRGV